jgi:hypothetical protein
MKERIAMLWLLTGIGLLFVLLALLAFTIRLPRWYDLSRINPLRWLRGCVTLFLLLVASGFLGLAALALISG